jgi:transcriptional regulator with XRE-family HTH domain
VPEVSESGPGTPAQEHETVGPALARLRKAKRISGAELGRMVRLSQPTISRLERDIGLPDPENVRRVAKALGASTEDIERLVVTAERAHDLMTDLKPGPTSLGKRQQVLGELEAKAREIRVFQPDIVIGLLQTSDYARAILTGFQQLHGTRSLAESIWIAVSERITRQVILTDPARSFHFILGEAALINQLCPPEFMPAQIQRIREVANQENVTLSIIPLDAVWPIAPLHGFTLLDETALLIDLFNTATISQGKSYNRAFRQIFDLYADTATTDIEPILERHLRHYLRLIQREGE